MFSFWPRQWLVPSVFCFRLIKFPFFISFRSFRPDFLSILYDRGAVPLWSKFPCECLRFRRINILRTHYHGFSMFIGATHTPSSRLYAPPTAVRTNKNDGAFSSLFWTILSRSLLRLSAPSLIRSSPLTQGKVWNSQGFQSKIPKIFNPLPCFSKKLYTFANE